MLDGTSNDRDVPPEISEEINEAVRIGITLTSGSVLGEKRSLEEVVEIISPLDRNGAIAVCAEWNRWNTWVMFRHGTWKPAAGDRQHLLDELLPSSAHWRATAAFEDEDFVSPFSEVSVLALISLVCRYSSVNSGRSMDERRSRLDLFRALLSLQESIFPENFFELSIPEQFPFEVRITLANISLQNRWAYDMGRLHALLTVPEISKSLNGITVREWFLKRLGVNGVDYECVVNTFLGSAFCCADFSRLEAQAPALFSRMRKLLELSTTSAENVVRGLNETHPQPDPTDLSEGIPYSSVLLVRPMIRLQDKLVCTSPRNLFNKLHRGLPYLCLEARTAPEEQRSRPRDEFGYIFEGYVAWLFKAWIEGNGVKLAMNYWIRQPDGAAERDLVAIRDEVAYVFEVKATVPAMKIRKFGGIEELVSLHKKAASQAYTASEALIQGIAFEDRELKTPLPKVKKVVPCAITYEFLAIRWPYGDCFEQALQQATSRPLFSGKDGILPFQTLDIQQVELLDDLFALPGDIASLFRALERRSLNEFKRYRDFPEDKKNSFRPDYLENPGVVRRLVDSAKRTSALRLEEISTEEQPTSLNS